MKYMKRRFKKACFGGTFDIPIHKGHAALIKKAFEVAEFCVIGLTSDRYACSLRKLDFTLIKPYVERKKNLIKFLESKRYSNRYEIRKLDNFCDRELLESETDIEAIVVSEERLWVAEEINKERERNGFKPFEIIKVPMILAEDKYPISSTRIRRGEIDSEGRLIRK